MDSGMRVRLAMVMVLVTALLAGCGSAIESNDPAHPMIEIPVTLTVLAGLPQSYLPMVVR